MPNFDPKKLTEFLANNKSVEDAIARSIPEPVLGMEQETPRFIPGSIVTINNPDGEREYRIINTKGGIVSYFDLTDRTKGSQLISETELAKIVNVEDQPEKPNVEPLSKLFSVFKEGTAYNLQHLLAWKKEWLDSGKLDQYREQHGNIAISNEQIEDTKRAIELYVQALQTEGLSRDTYEYAARQIGLSAKILSGVHHPPVNDIQHLVEHYSSLKANLDAFKEKIEKKPLPSTLPPGTPDIEPTKEESLPPDVRSTWPRHIVHDSKKGWTYTHNGVSEHLPTESWNAAEANIKPLFDEYFKYITEGNAHEQKKKVEFFSDVIALKNEIVGFLNAKDPNSARKYAEAFKELFEEQKHVWENLKKKEQYASSVELFDKKHATEHSFFDERLAVLKEVLSDEEIKPLLEKAEDLEDSYHQLRKLLERQAAGENSVHKKDIESAYTEELQALNRALTGKETEKKEELRKIRKGERVTIERQKMNVHQVGTWLTTNRLIHTIEDIQLDDTNKDKKIKVLGGEEMGLEDYIAHHKAQKAGGKVEITNDLLDEWHELAKTYHTGDTIDAKEFDELTSFFTYDRMFNRNENMFLGFYSTPEYNKEKNIVRYVSNKRFQMATPKMQNTIRKVFKAHDLFFVDQTPEEKREEREKIRKEEEVAVQPYKKVFQPMRARNKNFQRAEDEIGRLAAATQSHPDDASIQKEFDEAFQTYEAERNKLDTQETMAIENKFSAAKKRYEDLKRKRGRYGLPDTMKLPTGNASIQFADMEKNLDRLLQAMQAQQTEKTHAAFLAALNSYAISVEAEVKKKREEDELPKTIEGKEKRLEALKKIEAITNKRIENAKKTAEALWGDAIKKGNGMIRVTLATLILAGGTYYTFHDTTSTDKQVPQKQEQVVKEEASIEDYITERAKPLQKDIDSNMSMRDLVTKYASESINKDKPASIDAVLHMDGYKCMNTPNAYNLSGKQQSQLCDFISNLQNIHEAVYTPDRTKALMLGIPYTPPNDLPVGPQMTLEEYMQKVIKRYKDAKK